MDKASSAAVPGRELTETASTPGSDSVDMADTEVQRKLTRSLTKVQLSSDSNVQRRTTRRKGSDDAKNPNSSGQPSGGTAKVTKRPDKGKMYDARGVHTETGKDMCDCLNLSCPGCFFPCRRCGSPKCGPCCRCNRNALFESWETQGVPGSLIINPLMKKAPSTG